MGHYCSLRKKSCTETKHVPIRSLFLWIRPQQRTRLLIVVNASYQWPCSLLKSSNYYYLTRVKLKKTCALSGAIKKSKDPFSSLDDDGSSPMTGSWHGPRLGGSLGTGCCHSLEIEKGKAILFFLPLQALQAHSRAPKFPLLTPTMQASAAFKP